MAEAKPIPNEIMFAISQMMKGNPDTPEGKLLNLFMPSGVQSWMEQVGLGNKPGYMNRVGASLDVTDMVPGFGAIGAVAPKTIEAVKRIMAKQGSGMVPYTAKSDVMSGDARGFFYKNAPRLTEEDVAKMDKKQALKAILDDTPSAILGKHQSGDTIATAINREATHGQSFRDFMELREGLGAKDIPLDEMTAFMGDDYSKRMDGFLMKGPNKKVHYADRRVTAQLAEKGFGVNLFKDDGEAESVLLNMMKKVVKHAKMNDQDLLDFADVLNGKKSPYEIDHIRARLTDDVDAMQSYYELLDTMKKNRRK